MITTVLVILLAAITLYAILGGADFGAGIWEFNTAFRSSEKERDLLYQAIGPVWETNHVWLIFVLVLLFGAFPPAFASLNEALFLPLLIALVGIVFRGAAYAFRYQFKSQPMQAKAWVVLFSLSSILAPFFLGASVGAVASGELQFAADKSYVGDLWWGWVNPLSIFCGFFTVGLCAYVSATYMIRESQMANEPEIQDQWRRRSLIVGAIVGVFAMVGLVFVAITYPDMANGIYQRGWPAVLLSVIGGFVSLWAIQSRKAGLAVITVSLACATIVIGWGMAQYPDLIPGVWTAQESASPQSVLKLILIATGVGSVFLVPALILLFQIFKSARKNNAYDN